ncbi:DNA end-binding protein Ku [Haloactinopolyspora alba]|uniref:Non-homologous end joining protein Ku n=1 Tax=Haloactinopolyspora alba TaxID=648780 RepID=A0A2P8D3T2_9ACTN|nr:Ku protein [Haloactinopolyspora alba]PSK91878.1 DNA end-binding protein Ku [Haloactinopolyspora alba]
MARPVWSGSITFGMVSIPVALYSAVQHHEIRFNQFERGTSDRVRYKRVNERTGEEVDYADIVKGHDIGGGDYVVVEQDELAEIAPGKSRTLEISTFVEQDEIDPVYIQNSYYVAPSSDESATPYAVLCAALAESGRAGIATFVMHNKEHLALIRAAGAVLVLETMLFADEVREPESTLPRLPEPPAKGKQVSMAVDLINTMTGSWRPADYRDTYTERVEELIEAKRRGEEVTTSTEPQQASEPGDLLTALRESVESARRDRGRAKPDADLSEASKAELTRLARELDIPGRSRMNRDELADAVADAQKAAA